MKHALFYVIFICIYLCPLQLTVLMGFLEDENKQFFFLKEDAFFLILLKDLNGFLLR